jgi:hypothetical protein
LCNFLFFFIYQIVLFLAFYLLFSPLQLFKMNLSIYLKTENSIKKIDTIVTDFEFELKHLFACSFREMEKSL